MTLYEATSGNTGIALASVGAKARIQSSYIYAELG